MCSRRTLLVGALGVMLGAVPAGPAAGQSAARPLAWAASRPALEAAYTRLRVDAAGQSVPVDGLGVRLMWNLAPELARGAGLRPRTDLGLYGAFAPGRSAAAGAAVSTLAAGVAADVRPLAEPLAARWVGRVDPFVSLGAGVLSTRGSTLAQAAAPRTLVLSDGRRVTQFAAAAGVTPLRASSRTAFTLTPGAGVRVPVSPTVAVQADARDFVTFRDGTRHNWALGLGVRVGF
jgi:hypothetical protein